MITKLYFPNKPILADYSFKVANSVSHKFKKKDLLAMSRFLKKYKCKSLIVSDKIPFDASVILPRDLKYETCFNNMIPSVPNYSKHEYNGQLELIYKCSETGAGIYDRRFYLILGGDKYGKVNEDLQA